jgi:hypothetical protein
MAVGTVKLTSNEAEHMMTPVPKNSPTMIPGQGGTDVYPASATRIKSQKAGRIDNPGRLKPPVRSMLEAMRAVRDEVPNRGGRQTDVAAWCAEDDL